MSVAEDSANLHALNVFDELLLLQRFDCTGDDILMQAGLLF